MRKGVPCRVSCHFLLACPCKAGICSRYLVWDAKTLGLCKGAAAAPCASLCVEEHTRRGNLSAALPNSNPLLELSCTVQLEAPPAGLLMPLLVTKEDKGRARGGKGARPGCR